MAIWDKLQKHAFDDLKKRLNTPSALAFYTVFQFPRHDAISVALRWQEAQSTLFQEAADIDDQRINFDDAFLLNIRSFNHFSETFELVITNMLSTCWKMLKDKNQTALRMSKTSSNI